jgi:hypothetical protein
MNEDTPKRSTGRTIMIQDGRQTNRMLKPVLPTDLQRGRPTASMIPVQSKQPQQGATPGGPSKDSKKP